MIIPMKIISNPLTGITPDYPIENLGNRDEFLFLDIETTGLSAEFSMIYLIGCCYYERGRLTKRQWFAECPDDEAAILEDFSAFLSGFQTLVHFNGNQFDLPFLTERSRKHNISLSFDSFRGIDIYKRIFPYRHFLKLSNCKQKTLEQFLGIHREDTFTGGELISVYRKYVKEKDADALFLLLQHNSDDISGMIQLLPVLSYADFFQETPRITKVQTNTYRNIHEEDCKELLISFTFSSLFPRPISYHANDCYFSAREREGLVKVPIYTEEMKYFYSDYKNYYYLPEEDMAVHKSVASYVDAAFREQASAATCYTRKLSSYLPQWDYVFEPFFKREYKSPNLFFELTEELKSNRDAFSRYVIHILEMMVKTH